MKIKLIQPEMSLRPVDTEFKRLMAPSLALLVLAALTPEKYSVYIEDENVKSIDFNDNPDIVGITVNVDTSVRAFEIAKIYKAQNIPVILGGIYPSVNPDKALEYCDSVCIGEAEEQWPRMIEDVINGRLNPKYYSARPLDLAESPVPRWELLNKSDYLYTSVVCASRGCPFKCDFCYNSCDYVHNKFQNKPVENVIKEIDALNNKHVMFIDDNFIGNINWTKDFVKKITPLGLKWNCAVSANIVNNLDLLDDMRESGCQSLFIGFETLNNEAIRSVNKHQNKIELYEKLINEIHFRSMMVNASIVFGFDYDDKCVFDNTVDWLVKNKVETMTAHLLTPYPGTKLYARLEEEGRIIDFDLSKYNTSHVVFEPKNMTKQELYDGYINAYSRFYSIKNIFKRLPDNDDQKISYLLFNFGYRKYGRLTSKIARLLKMSSFGNFATKYSYKINKK
ncbi:MAG: radical SAM protein [Cyanobacteriota bacterium]